MELRKLRSVERPLLSRTDAVYSLTVEGATPSRIAIAQSLSSKEKGTVVVTHVTTQAGSQTSVVHARIYKDDKIAAAVERANLLAKQQPKVEATPAAEAA